MLHKLERYRNKKTGHSYDFLGLVWHSETQEKMVMYRRHDYSDNKIWVRPYDLFFVKFEKVED